MNSNTVTYILFSLAVIGALVIAAVPAPVFALPASASTAPQLTSPVQTSPSALVCRSVVVWRHSHRVLVRICHRAGAPG